METEMLFEPPEYSRKMLYHIYNTNLALLTKLQKQTVLTAHDEKDLTNLPSTLMICYLNGFEDAKQKLIDAKPLLKSVQNPDVFISFKDVMRILRKMKYSTLID
jgi:hypothetical protein